jgi:excisionase family DNA binding protein
MAAERQKARTKPSESEAPEAQKDKRADYLTARQLAEVLQISEATVHRLRRTGRIPAVLLTERLIRFNLRDVQKALRPTSSPHAPDDGDPEPSPQLTFEQVDPNFQ